MTERSNVMAETDALGIGGAFVGARSNGVDDVIMHGGCPTHFAPVVGTYGELRPQGPSNHPVPCPGAVAVS